MIIEYFLLKKNCRDLGLHEVIIEGNAEVVVKPSMIVSPDGFAIDKSLKIK
jgi:hypothetical protein